MTGTIFAETLRRNWRQALYWGVGLGLLGLYIMVFVGDANVLRQYAELAKSFPPALLQMFGGEDAAALATPEGFISFGFFGYTLLILAVFCVMAGLAVTANEEDSGILDVVLSLPVPRWRVVLERFLAYTVLLIAILAVSFSGFLVGSLVSTMPVNMGRLLEGVVNMLPSGLVMIALTVLAAAIIRRKSTATAVVASVIIISYFLDFIGRAVTNDVVAALRQLSFFTYYDNSGVMRAGLNAGNLALLLAVTVVMVAGSLWAFNRRDIGV